VTTPAPRPLRADARRNRDKLIEAAVRAFTASGREASLDAIAKDAGVGIGTLYRHFPTREELVEAAYRNELGRLCEGVGELLATQPPDRALRIWMDRFVDYMTTKREMADALRAVIDSGRNPFAQSRDRLVAAVTELLEAGAAAGTIRSDVGATDVFFSVSGVTLASGEPSQREQAGRMLDLLMDGLRPPNTP
jgi:AcrR family transcriptional regulator